MTTEKMDKSELIESIRLLILSDIEVSSWKESLETKLNVVYNRHQIGFQETLEKTTDISKLNFSQTVTEEWKYICLGFYLIRSITESCENSDTFLSVQESKDFKKFLKCIIYVGICTKLQPKMPFYCKSKFQDSSDIFFNYNVLKCTTFGLVEFLKIPVLRLSIIPEGLKEILVSLYQISYCPLKKPTDNEVNEMSVEMYEKLLVEQRFFTKILKDLNKSIHPNIFVKDTMVILHKNAPHWFKKQVSHTLTNILLSKNGVEVIAISLFGDYENDTNQIWKILDVFTKLILSTRNFPGFKENICKQLIDLLHKQQDRKTFAENIFVHVTKKIYKEDEELARSVFLRAIFSPFLFFTYSNHNFNNEDITTKIEASSRILHAIFVETSGEDNLPSDILRPIINVIFRFYVLTDKTTLKSINNDLKDVLIVYLENQLKDDIYLFDRLIFDIDCKEILPFRNDIHIEINNNSIKLNKVGYNVKFSSTENCESIFQLIISKSKLLIKLFGFFLNCIRNEEKYFKKANEDLLYLEDNLATESLEGKIIVYKLLAEIAEIESVQKELSKDSYDVIQYIYEVLNKTVETGAHLSEDVDNDCFHSIFTVLMVLENLVTNSLKSNYKNFEILIKPLSKIQQETRNKEMAELIKSIFNSLAGLCSNKRQVVQNDPKTELDKVIDDICDPLLPTRGHGLLTLTKLIEKKDNDVLERKQFILNLLQQNLSNKDSFIYLNAINGLAAMADIFPDTILNILCEEYSDSNRKDTEDNAEVRMKLGEVLVKVSKVLGEMAPKHKPLLLNTFLIGTKDNDDLIRASSLSNLGEICRVLGYKLGTMFTEVLSCVHSIIATDKSQARRAAVTVIRQLFVGLDQEIIAFFKEDILPVYRSLKHIYNNDKDDVMRLQAQLALEELNESMKNFVFPKPELNFDKKIVMLNKK